MQPEPHPQNRDFVWSSPRGPYRRLTAQQAGDFDEQGFCVIENALAPALLRSVIAEIDPWEAKVEAALQSLPERKMFIARAGEITFTTHLVQRSEKLRAFCASALFQDLAHDLIGPDVRLYWDQAVYKKPGAKDDFPWHQDNGYTYIEPQNYLTVWIALTDATRDNGCPWIVPGLHRRGTLRHWMTPLGWRCLEDAPDAVPCEVRPGSAVVFSSLTPHATGPNRTRDVRKSYIVQFAPAGAAVVATGDDGSPPTLQLCNDARRQFPILIEGKPPA